MIVVMMLINLSIIDFGSGPTWSRVYAYLTQPCEQFWWSTLLYVQIYVNPYNGDVSIFTNTYLL